MRKSIKQRWKCVFYGLSALPVMLLIGSSITEVYSKWLNGLILICIVMAAWVGKNKLGANDEIHDGQRRRDE